MTNVLLVYPVPSISSPQKSPPLSILYVGQALKAAKARGMSDESFTVRYYDERYDPTPDLDWPDVVGVSSMTGYQLKGAIRWLKEAKAHHKKTILGGIHVTMQPEQCLEEDYIDSVVLGAGEWAVLDAIGGARVAQQPLSGRHISPVSADTAIHFTRSAKSGDTILLSSRGCLFRCGFCYTQKFFSRRWESVDLERWKYDVWYLKTYCGLTKLEHGDDWIGRWPRAREIITYLKQMGIAYRPSIRAHQITEDVAHEMRDLGVRHVSVGMETASQRMLDLVQKDITPSDQVRAAEALAKYNIWPLYYWIIGFPTETQAEMNETLDAADRMARIHKGRLTQDIYAYVALPGSNLYEMVDKSKLPHDMEGWSNYSLNQTYNRTASSIYHIGGFHFHGRRGDKTSRNFPGLRRLEILPFEIACHLRWKLRYFEHFAAEKRAIEALLKRASQRTT